jgi:hypothetical protein
MFLADISLCNRYQEMLLYYYLTIKEKEKQTGRKVTQPRCFCHLLAISVLLKMALSSGRTSDPVWYMVISRQCDRERDTTLSKPLKQKKKHTFILMSFKH